MAPDHPTEVSLDDVTVALVVDIPAERVMLFQALFDLTEYVGITRTLDPKRGTVCIITPRSMIRYCLEIFDSCRELIGWRAPTVVPPIVIS